MRSFSVFYTALFWVCAFVSALFVVTTLSYDLYAPWGILIVLTAGALGFFAPSVGSALALFIAPLGGNRPGTSQAFLTVLAGASLFLGMALRGSRRNGRSLSSMSQEELRNPLIFLGLLYCLFSAASLISIPITHVLDDLRNLSSRESLKAIGFSVYSLIFTSEHTLVYSFISVYYTALAFLLGLAVYRMCVLDTERLPKFFVGAAFLGLLASLVVGVLDYYGFIDLLWLRGLDPIVNPGGKQFRLQSLFGHSGWYAEYLTLAIPTCLIVLALQLPFWMRTVAILLALALGEFVLILTYQRGGWLSYPLTLVAVWASIYVVRLLERHESDIGRALRRSVVKVLVSLPLTVIVSLIVVVVIQGKSSVEDAMSPYVSRFKDIQRTGDRTDFLQAGFLIGSLHPILGGGADSFAWQFEREIESPQGAFPGRFVLPLHGSAHNVYAQTFSGKGLCGLLTLIAIPLLLLAATPRVLRSSKRTIAEKLTMVTGACYGCAFLIYGNVQEVFYVQVLQFMFFCIVGIVAAVAYKPVDVAAKKLLVSPWVCAGLIALHIVWEFFVPGHARAFYAESRRFGCFPGEAAPNGTTYRWCGERALIERPVAQDAQVLDIIVEAGPLPQVLSISTEGASPISLTLAPGERQVAHLDLSGKTHATGRVLIRFDATTSFIPKLLWPTSADTRRLAFRVQEP
ncbi:MAG: hypothetical protein RL518_584 [Pseudomonadota bacterium]